MSRSAKHLKVPLGHVRSQGKLDEQVLALLGQKTCHHGAKCNASPVSLKSSSSLTQPPANLLKRSSLSPVRNEVPTFTPQALPVFIRRSISKERGEVTLPEGKAGIEVKTSDDSLDSGRRKRTIRRSVLTSVLGDIEIRLNERLIKGSQSSDAREKFLACREALQDIIDACPDMSSLLRKVAKGIDAWTGSLESLRLTGEQTVKTNEDNEKLRGKIALLSKENAHLSKQISDMISSSRFPSPDSHVSSLISSLQDEVRIHRKREDLLMDIITAMRDKGYPVGDIHRSPHSEKQLSEESTRSCAEMDKNAFEVIISEDRDIDESSLTYSPTPGFETEDSVQLLPSDARASVPRLTLPISNDIAHKGVDLRLKTHLPASP